MFASFARTFGSAVAAVAFLASPATAGKLYTSVDFGAPPVSLAPQNDASPWVFNNTGQMAGTYAPPEGGAPWCLAYTGKAWINITYPTGRLCEAWAISDRNRSGTFGVVGRIGTEFEYGDKSGYYSTITGSTASMHIYGANYPSAIEWINETGLAIGRSSFMIPQSNLNWPYLMASTAGGTTPFRLLDACAQAPGSLCPTYDGENTSGYGGNHQRVLNASGTDFAVDLGSNNIMEGKIGTPSASFDLPINRSAISCFSPLGIDDAGNFYYSQCTPGNPGVAYVYRYNVALKKIAQIPPIAGSDCTEYVPWTMNGSGEMYGTNQNCNKSPLVTWIYNPARS